ncbi:TKL/TKL-ccin protein kinase [Collybia nuda]|uniref:TKL/TKL-ccin protein kinase n=1 Tax=Collybia nuda TaxID=64659 RepID=A0A9P5Y5V8_9AGAR|nr:TKL/TKL-ccin protein kinase [Collybia nuda]
MPRVYLHHSQYPMSNPTRHLNFDTEQRPCKDLTGTVTKTKEYSVGYGGFSDVYEGVFNGTKDYVAIKIFRGIHTNKTELEHITKRINRETYVWQKLNHKNVLKFLGVCTDLYASSALISPFCDAGSVKEYVKEHPDVNRSVMIFGIAEGLAYLHQKNVLHGDLKPQNILIGKHGEPLICDFGQSKLCHIRGFTTRFAGSYHYVAPELVPKEGEPKITKESDVYSFGIVGMELITDKAPFDTSKTDAEVISKVQAGDHPAKGRKIPHAYELTWSVLENCWGREPESRIAMNSVIERLPRQ